MCDIMERLMRENNEQSYEKGRQEEKISMIKNAIAKGYTYNDIAEFVNLSVEEVKGLANA